MHLTGPRPLRLLGTAENGRRDGDYRGILELRGTGTTVLVVDDVGLERYLTGVAPSEMPPSWPSAGQIAERLAELRLQGELVDLAVTARTPTGRASLVRVTTTASQADLEAGRVRALLGLRSTWFSVTPSAASGALRTHAR